MFLGELSGPAVSMSELDIYQKLKILGKKNDLFLKVIINYIF